MKTIINCCKFAIILTFIFSFTTAKAASITLVTASFDMENYNHPGDTIKLSYKLDIDDNWSGEIKSINIAVYASSDTTITEDDYDLWSKTESIGEGDYSMLSNKSFQIPNYIPPGEYYIGFIITVDTGSEITFCQSTSVLIDPALTPDLMVSYKALGDSSHFLLPGGTGLVSIEIKNVGFYKSGQFYINFYASKDTEITAGDYSLGGETFSSLSPDESTSNSLSFYLSKSIPSGYYYILGKVVCPSESNLDNNIFCGDSFFVVPPIDLSVEDVSVESGFYRPGDSIKVTVSVENTNTISSSGYMVSYYVSNDDTNIDLENYLERDGLEPGEMDTFETSFTFPQNIPQGDYYIKATIICQDDTRLYNNERLSNSRFWVGPVSDLKVESIDTNGIYEPNDTISVYTLIKNIGDRASEDYTVDFYASVDETITQQDIHIGYVERDGLEAGKQHSYNTTCQFPLNIPAGLYYIGIIVSNPKDYSSLNNDGFDGTKINLIHPPNYVCGKVEYSDIRYNFHPVRYARINFYNRNYSSNSLDGEIIGQTYTDRNGTYGTVVLNDANSANQIYFKVFAEGVSGAYPGTTSTICNVKDDILDQTYFAKSTVFYHPRNSSAITDLKIQQSEGSFMVFDSVVEAFHRARNFLVMEPNIIESNAIEPNVMEPNAIEPNGITVYWPCSLNSSFYYPSAGIFIAQDDRSDRDVIMHEYGHYIANIFNFAQGYVGDNSTHFWDLDLRYSPVYRPDYCAANLAFREAFATLFSIALQYGQSNYPYSGDTCYQDYDEAAQLTYTVDLEKGTKTHKSPGQYFENMNCCALWDIFDENNDSVDNQDLLSDTSLSKIWTVMRDEKPYDIIDFWNGWFKNFQYTDEMTRIYQDHRIEH